jgi:hypothetical protein
VCATAGGRIGLPLAIDPTPTELMRLGLVIELVIER